MKMIAAVLISFLFTTSIFGFEFKGGFWEKETCQSLDPQCLPQTIGQIKSYEMIEPANESARRLVIQSDLYKAQMLWTKRTTQGGYYSFQISLYNLNGDLISQCARYESLTTFENVPVGSCSGFDEAKGKIVGFTVYRP